MNTIRNASSNKIRSEHIANMQLANSVSATSKMNKIQSLDKSFKFRLGAMAAMTAMNPIHVCNYK